MANHIRKLLTLFRKDYFLSLKEDNKILKEDKKLIEFHITHFIEDFLEKKKIEISLLDRKVFYWWGRGMIHAHVLWLSIWIIKRLFFH